MPFSASTRPPTLDLSTDADTRWLGLEIRRHEATGEDTAIVEFIARYKIGGRAHRLHEVSRFEGPERIASEGWRAKDGNPAHSAPTRDYYRVEDRRGRRFWIFRHGLYDGAEEHPGWYLHGLFA